MKLKLGEARQSFANLVGSRHEKCWFQGFTRMPLAGQVLSPTQPKVPE